MELPDVTQTKANTKSRLILPVVIVLILAGIGFLAYRTILGSAPSADVQAQGGTVSAPDGTLTPYVDFAENLTIALNNISYTNQNEQRADLAEYLADDLLTTYHKYFYDPDFQRLVADRKIFITFQKIQRSSVESMAGDVVAVKVIGYNTYRSNLSQTQLEIPFTLLVQVEKRPDGRLQATKIKKL